LDKDKWDKHYKGERPTNLMH